MKSDLILSGEFQNLFVRQESVGNSVLLIISEKFEVIFKFESALWDVVNVLRTGDALVIFHGENLLCRFPGSSWAATLDGYVLGALRVSSGLLVVSEISVCLYDAFGNLVEKKDSYKDRISGYSSDETGVYISLDNEETYKLDALIGGGGVKS